MTSPSSIEQNAAHTARMSRPATPGDPDIMPGSSAGSQIGEPGWAKSEDALDSREEKPRNWDEVCMLQEALRSSVRSFTRVTARTPPSVSDSHWLSYADQLEILQRESDRCWAADQRRGLPPKLAKLAAWEGGILAIGTAGLRITEEMTEMFLHPRLRGQKHLDGSSGWYQNTFGEQTYNKAGLVLSAADARIESSRAQNVKGEEQQDVAEDMTETLDRIVARDPEKYLGWLSTMGYSYFTMASHNPYGLSWEDWCKWKAPWSFEICCKQDSVVMRPPFGPGAIDRTKYGPPGDRPTITLDEAKKGSSRVAESRDRDDGNGMEVSREERAQRYMTGGGQMSQEATAHRHFMRGEDVLLFESRNSLAEVIKDPSRQGEAEVEANFHGP